MTVSTDYQFPTLRNEAAQIVPVLDHFALRNVIGLGVGSEAVILLHLVMAAPDWFLGMAVIDPSNKSIKFGDWTEQKLAAYALGKKGFTEKAKKFLMWHLFGAKSTKKSACVDVVKKCIANNTLHQKPYNLLQYDKAYMNRKDVVTDGH